MAGKAFEENSWRSPSPRKDVVVWDVIEEHLAEADFLAGQWLAAARSPRISSRLRQITIEPRIVAHLDGLILGGAAVADRTLWPLLTGNDADDMAPLLGAALGLLVEGNGTTINRLVDLVRDTREAVVRAAVSKALDLTARADVIEPVRLALYTTDDPPAQAALLAILAARGVAPGPILGALLASPSEPVLAAALSAAAAIAVPDRDRYYAALEEQLTHPTPAVQRAALRTGLIWNLRSAWQSCERQARAGDPDATTFWSSLGGATAVSTLIATLSSPHSRRAALFALGFSGSVDAIDACLPLLADPDPPVARLAAEAIGAISGLDVNQAPFALPPPEEDADELQPPDADAIRTWWAERRETFVPHGRYLYGQSWSLASVERALVERPLRRFGPASERDYDPHRRSRRARCASARSGVADAPGRDRGRASSRDRLAVRPARLLPSTTRRVQNLDADSCGH